MELSGIWGGFYRVSLRVSKMAYANALWVLFSLLGLIVLGIAPATVALFSITKDWAKKDWDQPVFQTFWQTYKTEFFRANGVGWAFFVIGFLIYWNFTLFAGASIVMMVIRAFLLMVTVLFAGTLLLFFPTYVNFHLKGLARVRAALMMACGHPLHVVLLMASIVALQAVFMYLPGLIIFFAAATIAYVISWFAHHIFEAMKKKQTIENEAISHG
ncbi:YesL family protein [Alkalihalobacillus pseudalcaliphilus]|uniref:YesL family protein n=1 Tax=Alkalihalobacillus pseudalcaliphilus TaxID=79884 RepID=UPI00064DC64B|nr:YesL family protein [Alkalihalobacillus pseudalcaliphilus]KMK74400.1 hypothetical protein AB990_21035 [Alkalihalobacillus pseudalcaliphilus]